MGFLIIVVFLFNVQLFAEELKKPGDMSCAEILNESHERIRIIRGNVKKGYDITVSFPRLEKIINLRPDCVSWSKLQISDNEVASYRKFIFAPDKSFDLDDKKCSSLKVDTSNMPDNHAQGNFDWCHSFVAADLVSFVEGVKLSAYDFGVTYTQDAEKRKQIVEDINLARKKSKKKPLQESEVNFTEAYGKVTDAIDSAIKSPKGICLEKEFFPDKGDWYEFSNKLKNFSSDTFSCYGGEKIFDSLGYDVLEIIKKLSPEKRISLLIDLNCKKGFRFLKNYLLTFMDLITTHKNN